MIRTQIQLTEAQAERVKRIARARGVSIATVIRDAVDQLDDCDERADREGWERFSAAVGAFRGGPGAVSEQHDDALPRLCLRSRFRAPGFQGGVFR